jgi:hypothetical protein
MVMFGLHALETRHGFHYAGQLCDRLRWFAGMLIIVLGFVILCFLVVQPSDVGLPSPYGSGQPEEEKEEVSGAFAAFGVPYGVYSALLHIKTPDAYACIVCRGGGLALV